MDIFQLLLSMAAAISLTTAASYFPEILYGTPVSVDVVEKQGPDFRGLPVYLITLSVEVESKQVKNSLVHRNYDEFLLLVKRINELNFTRDGLISLPGADDVTIEELDTLLKDLIETPGVPELETFTDFLSINWNADGVEWFETIDTFMYMLLFARIPEFQPEPAVFETELDVAHPEVPFEKYVYITAFRHEEVFGDIELYMQFFKNWTDTTPGFEGPEGDVDVLPPNALGPIELPFHFTKTFVHFLPGGYTNGHTVRISQTGNTKFNFLKEDILKEWIETLHGHRQGLKRILDIGTGNCHSAFAFAEMYPEAEVFGIDLAAPYIRFCNVWKAEKGLTNVHFYQDNAEMTHFESESFDLIQYTYVLHEMPAINCEMVLEEALRLLKPGGVLSGFEVPFVDNFALRQSMIAFQTWGCEWNSTCDHGPEPYTGEFQDKTRLPRMLTDVGFVNTEDIFFSVFDGIIVTYKPE